VEATSPAAGAKGNSSSWEKGRPLNMLPAWLATHRAARGLPVNNDPVAAGSAAVLGPLALPASRDLGALGRAHQGNQLRIALGQLDAQRLIAVDESSGCRLRCERNRHRSLLPRAFARSSCRRFRALRFGVVREARQLPPSRGTAFERLALTQRVFHSFRSHESVPSSLHRHQLPLFDFADGLFADREWLLGCPFSAAQADETLRTISNASSGLWTDPRIAFSTRSSESAN